MFRLSSPAVAIGCILLIPSILGMIVCAISFVNNNAREGESPRPVLNEQIQPWQSSSVANFRSICAERVIAKFRRQESANHELLLRSGVNVNSQLAKRTVLLLKLLRYGISE